MDSAELREGDRCYAEVTPGPLDLAKYVALVGDDGAGAIATFSGVTRNSFQGKTTERLEYEAYVPMAAKKLLVRGVGGQGRAREGRGGKRCRRGGSGRCCPKPLDSSMPLQWPPCELPPAAVILPSMPHAHPLSHAAMPPLLQELCQQACAKWQLCKVAMAHRTSVVLVGEASVVIAVSSAHRREALEVCKVVWVDGGWMVSAAAGLLLLALLPHEPLLASLLPPFATLDSALPPAGCPLPPAGLPLGHRRAESHCAHLEERSI
jgi:molybdopterin synthase catalytic subunit